MSAVLHPDQDIEHHHDKTHSTEALEDNAALDEKQHVGFAARVYPLLEMLRTAMSVPGGFMRAG